jgi:hypothetical protein
MQTTPLLEGLDHFRWEMTNNQNGVVYRQIMYFYGAGDQVLIITFTRSNNQGRELDALVDETMATVRFNP